MRLNKYFMRAFTIIESIIVLSVWLVLILMGLPALQNFLKDSSLTNAAEKIKNTLYLGQNRTLASEGKSSYGVFFDENSSPDSYTLFKGSTYASRDLTADQVYQLPARLEFYQINFGGSKEAVFRRITAEPVQSGYAGLRIIDQPVKTKEVWLSSAGIISIDASSSPSDVERIKDSRHVHFDYSRTIDVFTENLRLEWSGVSSTTTQTINISDSLQAGNILWKGTVKVDGEDQIITLRSHRLNNPDTQFSITRDRRYNTKALQISLDGDLTGHLIVYDISASTTQGTSIYVSQPIWQ